MNSIPESLPAQHIDSLARARILAITYIEGQEEGDPDADIAAQESIAAEFQHASAQEQASLVRAAHALGFPDWPEEMGLG